MKIHTGKSEKCYFYVISNALFFIIDLQEKSPTSVLFAKNSLDSPVR